MPVYFLSEDLIFPAPKYASSEGLLAIGGDLSPERLILAYQQGIFPWYASGQPIMWWSPDPRLVLYPEKINISKRLKRIIRQQSFAITMDTAFNAVIQNCAAVNRKGGQGTWIVDDMIAAYCRLHDFGFAHSVEAWIGEELAGGLYGVSLGRCFFGESMFALKSNASKVAFVALVEHLNRHDFAIVDCQVTTDHLIRFGAKEIPRDQFLMELEEALRFPTLRGSWGDY